MSSISLDKSNSHVVVIGAGIGGLTAGALLAHRGYSVLILDQASYQEAVLRRLNGRDLPLMWEQLRWRGWNQGEFTTAFSQNCQ